VKAELFHVDEHTEKTKLFAILQTRLKKDHDQPKVVTRTRKNLQCCTRPESGVRISGGSSKGITRAAGWDH